MASLWFHPDFLIFLRKRGKKAETMHMTEKIDMGIGSGSSATSGERMVVPRANILQMPNAVVQRAVGNICGVAKYDRLNTKEMPNLAKRTNTAISMSSALKKITMKIPPAAASINEIM